MHDIFMCYDFSLQLLQVIWLALIEWSLHTRFEHWQNPQSFFSCSWLLEKMELRWVQNGTLGFEKIQYTKKPYSRRNVNFVPWRFERTNTKVGKTVTLYHRELLKKRPSLSTFCTYSLVQSLMRSFLKKYPTFALEKGRQ